MAIGGFGVAYVVARLPHWFQPLSFDRASYAPIGVLSAVTSPLPPLALVSLVIVTIIAGALFVAGRYARAAGPLYALALLLLTTYRNSWGMIFHVENLLVLHTLALCLAPVGNVWVFGKNAARTEMSPPRVVSGWCVRLLCLLTVLTYLIAGVAKLRASGIGWAGGDVLREHIAYDAVRKLELGSMPSPIAPLIVGIPALFPPLAAVTLLVEIGAPIALLGPRLARGWCLAAFSFHFGVLALMGIVFAYPLLFVAYLPFFPVERWAWVRRWTQRAGAPPALATSD
jgi:hypothetical protein